MVPDFSGTLNPSLAARYGVSGGLVKPDPGFRGAAGYQWKGLRFSLETGYTHIKGDNPLVLDISFVPLSLKAGYVFSLWNFSIIPLLGAGMIFSHVTHYETAINMLLEKKSRSSSTGFLANAGLRLGWSFIPALTLYAGAGIDCVVETGGFIPFPSLEFGLTVRPFMFGKKAPGRPPRRADAPRPGPEPAAARTEPAEEPAPVPDEPAAPPEPESGTTAEPPEPAGRVLMVLYFPADTAVPVPSHLVELDGAAELLREYPAAGVTLRGYAAPYGTPEGQRALSEARARFCEGYLREQGVDGGRITTEWYGAEKLPEAWEGFEWQRRRVEIIVE
jgi:outer membrane protein OmpA-like peptidoglycan-associated protein